jgi:hypothetical protein
MLYEIQLSVSYLSDQFRREKVDLQVMRRKRQA